MDSMVLLSLSFNPIAATHACSHLQTQDWDPTRTEVGGEVRGGGRKERRKAASVTFRFLHPRHLESSIPTGLLQLIFTWAVSLVK